MSRERVAEMLEFYGADIMLLIGGGLLEARERLTEATAAFVAEVHGYVGKRTMSSERPIHRKATDDYRWDSVDLLPYKEDDRALFKAITRQTLFSDPAMNGRAALFRDGGGRLLDAGAARAHACGADPARPRPLPGRRRGARRSRPATSSPCRR